VATDAQSLLLAFRGSGVLRNSAEDPKFIFKGGFCFDLALRTNSKSKEKGLDAGDKRLLVGPFKGKWTAVLFDYVDKSVPDENYVEYTSPVATTRVARVTVLPPDAVKIVVKSQKAAGSADAFTAEIAVAWSALGLPAVPTGNLRGDVGVLLADPTGASVESRAFWADAETDAITDIAVEAAIRPGALGTLRFGK
jgi:hypothetical protein